MKLQYTRREVQLSSDLDEYLIGTAEFTVEYHQADEDVGERGLVVSGIDLFGMQIGGLWLDRDQLIKVAGIEDVYAAEREVGPAAADYVDDNG